MAWKLFRSSSTGWLDLRPFLINGWTGRVIGVRDGQLIKLRVDELSAAAATSAAFLSLPVPLAPSLPSGAGPMFERFLLHRSDSTPTIRRGSILGTSPTLATGWQAGDVLYGGMDYRTTQPWAPIGAVKL